MKGQHLPLKDTRTGVVYRIFDIDKSLADFRRLYEMGFVANAEIERLFDSPDRACIAFFIFDSTIALRKADCDRIFVTRRDNERIYRHEE